LIELKIKSCINKKPSPKRENTQPQIILTENPVEEIKIEEISKND
jgi:hypothetical protein